MPPCPERVHDNGDMHGLFAGLATLDIAHAVPTVPDPFRKVTSSAHFLAAGGPATNAAVTFAALDRVAEGEGVDAGSALLCARGRGPLSDLLSEDLLECGVSLLDATGVDGPVDPSSEDAASGGGGPRVDPALSGIVEHPGGRMVVSSNTRLAVDPDLARRELAALIARQGEPDVVLVDGHNPELADLVLRLGTRNEVGQTLPVGEDPFAEVEDRPDHLRILDGGSWKPWLPPLLGFVDVAVVSADFHPPVVAEYEGDGVAEFLAGFGITRVVRTDGGGPIRWWWDGLRGEVCVEEVQDASTLGAGDIFHGALAWALARGRRRGGGLVAGTRAGAGPLRDVIDVEAVITFAARVATLSTRSFGTRAWRGAPELEDLVTAFMRMVD